MVELGMSNYQSMNKLKEQRLTFQTEERSEDMCPICKTDRYLSPNMKFLVNAECYHKMCESCVDRIFALGPAPCPYPGCGKTLRKNKFKEQIFDDIGVEREVDIRKRIQNIFNKKLEDFDDDLIKYNEYLENVEDTVFKLVNSVDVEETESMIQKYKLQNQNTIEQNQQLMAKELEEFKQQEELEKDLKLKKQILERQIEQEDKEFNELAKKNMINQLADGKDAALTLQNYKKNQLKRSSASRKKLREITDSLNNSKNPKQKSQTQSVPFTPFNGDRMIKKNFKVVKSYYDPFIDELTTKKDYIAAGFKVTHVYERIITEAFTGLGCIIDKEKAKAIATES